MAGIQEPSETMVVAESRPAVFVVILSWNGIESTERCLRSLLLSSYEKIEILVIDNGSRVNEAQRLQKVFDDQRLRFLRLDINLGFAEAANLGMMMAIRARAEYVLLLNNDTEVEHDAIEHLVNAAQMRTKGAAFGPVIKNLDDRMSIQSAGGEITLWKSLVKIRTTIPEDTDQPYETGWLSGAALMITVDSLHRIGMLDPRYFAYREETDFEYRLKCASAQLICVPRAIVFHRRGSPAKMDLVLWVNWTTRNRILFVRKFGGLATIVGFSVYYFLWSLPAAIGSRMLNSSDVCTFRQTCEVIRLLLGGIIHGFVMQARSQPLREGRSEFRNHANR